MSAVKPADCPGEVNNNLSEELDVAHLPEESIKCQKVTEKRNRHSFATGENRNSVVTKRPCVRSASIPDTFDTQHKKFQILPSDLEMFLKMEEANRQIGLSPSPVAPTDPSELELLIRLEQANRLLEVDKRSCNALTPTHSRNGSYADIVASGHSRKGSSTTQLSLSSSNDQGTEEELGSSTNNLWEIWGTLINDWASAKKKPAFIKHLVRKGIPYPYRSLAWQLLLDVNNSPMKDKYVEYLKQKSPSEKMIRRDIARTFPEHNFFKEKDGIGQESLFNVMKAYSLYDREVGYCQGSGFIVGLLLMQLPEEEAFAVLVKLMQDYGLRELFTPSMAKLGLCMYKLECLIQELLPDLYTHFQTQSFYTSMYASSWFLTLFITVLPINVAYRVMDLFISEGMDVILRLAIAILQSSWSEILAMDMEAMLQFFQKDISALFEKDEEKLFNVAFQVRISAKKFKRLEKEYTALKSKETEDQVELRRLRTENRLLRQRIDNLEKEVILQESASLADRLIQYQLTRAQEAEETYALKNELSLMKQKYSLAQKQLKEAESLIGDIKERTDSINSASSLDDSEAQAVVQNLQEELIMVRLREAENNSNIKNLRNKVEELQQLNTRLQQAPCNDVQCLQEELIAVKLREAEANLSLKEMRQTVNELESMWQRHLGRAHPGSSTRERSSSKNELKGELKKTQEELMSSKLREAAALSYLKDAKQKIMELETSNQICSNQIRRMDEENKKAKMDIEAKGKEADELQKQTKALIRKIDDLDSKHHEELMMARIREAESDQVVGELKQKIAQMEIQREEVLAADILESKGGKQDLENTIFDLQEEVMQLKMSASPKSHSASALPSSPRPAGKIDDEDDFNDEDEDNEDPESLNHTLSEIIEGKRSNTSLIAILNRDNSDSDSVVSSGSDASASGQKLQKLNTSDKKVVTDAKCGGIVNNKSLNKNCDNGASLWDIQENESAINQSELIEQTDLHLCTTKGINNSAITLKQSKYEINDIVNSVIFLEDDCNINVTNGLKIKH